MLMTEAEAKTVLSKARYWNEIIKRSNQDVLKQELYTEIQEFGVKLLFVLEHYAKYAKNIYDESKIEENRAAEED